MDSTQNIDFRSLLTRLDANTQATIVLPQDPEYQELLLRFNEINVKPAGAIFLPTTPQEVSAAVKFVIEHNIDLAVTTGGYSSEASSTNGGLLISMRKMNTVTVDIEKKTVTAEGGCIWDDVNQAAAKHDLVVVGGLINKVGVAGLSVGGGYGYLSGQYGLVIDNLLSAELVLASGEIVRVSNEENQDLFWAVRGAGASFGIFTKLTFKAHDQKNKVYTGVLVYTPEASIISPILDFVNSYYRSERDDGRAFITFYVSLDEPQWKEVVLTVAIFFNGTEEEGSKFIKPLTDLNPRETHLFEMPYEQATGLYGKIATFGDRKINKPFSFTLPLQLSTITDIFDNFKALLKKYEHDPSIIYSGMAFFLTSTQKISEFNNGCFANRGDRHKGTIVPRWTIKENDEELLGWARRMAREIIDKNGVVLNDGRRPIYPNYDDPKHSAHDCFGDNFPRLKELKNKYDPNNVFNKWSAAVWK